MGCGQSNPTLLLQLNKILMQQQICWEAIYQLNPYLCTGCRENTKTLLSLVLATPTMDTG